MAIIQARIFGFTRIANFASLPLEIAFALAEEHGTFRVALTSILARTGLARVAYLAVVSSISVFTVAEIIVAFGVTFAVVFAWIGRAGIRSLVLFFFAKIR